MTPPILGRLQVSASLTDETQQSKVYFWPFSSDVSEATKAGRESQGYVPVTWKGLSSGDEFNILISSETEIIMRDPRDISKGHQDLWGTGRKTGGEDADELPQVQLS